MPSPRGRLMLVVRTTLVVLLALQSCAVVTDEERGQYRAQRIIATYSPLCESLGSVKGTKDWAECVERSYESAQHRENEARKRRFTCTSHGNETVCR